MSIYQDIEVTEKDIDFVDSEPVGYQSPLMARMQGSGKLTISLLAEEVPYFHAGEKAAKKLAEEDYDITDQEVYENLVQDTRRGEQAKECLFLAGIPLIKHLAKKEHLRRQAWQSRVTYEDLFQEGAGGFILGLRAYKPSGNQKSATNYLGQWILTDMRRNTETIDNDFGVAYDAAEQFRKIRAIRSRLTSSLGREPSDEEILEAASESVFKGGQKMGRINKKTGPLRRPITQTQLDKEKEFRDTVGQTRRFSVIQDETETNNDPLDQVRTVEGTEFQAGHTIEEVIEQGQATGLVKLMVETFNLMGLPNAQRQIIGRRYGLPPHIREQSPREICRELNLHRETVGQVLEAFTQEMSQPGGAFHKACNTWDPEDLADIGLGWTKTVLGDYQTVKQTTSTHKLPQALIKSLPTRRGTIPPPPDQNTHTNQVRAQFVCEYHDWGFLGVYLKKSDVPQTRDCPMCGRPSPLIRIRQD